MISFLSVYVCQLFNMIVPGSNGKVALNDVLSASDGRLSAASDFINEMEQKYYEKKYAWEDMEGGGIPPQFADDDAEVLLGDQYSEDVDGEVWRKVHEHQDL